MRRRWTTFSSRPPWMRPVTSSVGVPRRWSSLRPRGPAAVAAAVADLPLYLSKAVSLFFGGAAFVLLGAYAAVGGFRSVRRLLFGQAVGVRLWWVRRRPSRWARRAPTAYQSRSGGLKVLPRMGCRIVGRSRSWENSIRQLAMSAITAAVVERRRGARTSSRK